MSKLEMYRSYLKTQGYPCEVRDDFIAFKHEGGNYVVTADDSDASYFQLIYPKFWKLDKPADRQRGLEVASHVNQMVKGLKVFSVGTDTYAAIELFLPKPEDFQAIFPRALRAIQAGTQHFCMAILDIDAEGATRRTPRIIRFEVVEPLGSNDSALAEASSRAACACARSSTRGSGS